MAATAALVLVAAAAAALAAGMWTDSWRWIVGSVVTCAGALVILVAGVLRRPRGRGAA